MKSLAWLVLAILGSATAFADDPIYLTANSSYKKEFLAHSWSDTTITTAVEAAKHDYLVPNSRSLQLKSEEVVPAKSLTIGQAGVTGSATYYCYYSATFKNEGLKLANGVWHDHTARTPTFKGDIEVTSPKTAPFTIRTNGERTEGTVFVFTDDPDVAGTSRFYAADTAGVILKGITNNAASLAASPLVAFKFQSDTSEFLGEMTLQGALSVHKATGTMIPCRVQLENESFGGTIKLDDDNCTLYTTTNVTIKSVSLAKGSTLSVSTNTMITVQDENMVVNAPVKVQIRDTAKGFANETTIPVLRVHRGADTSVDDYELEVSGNQFRYEGKTSWVEDTENTLRVTYLPTVTYTGKGGQFSSSTSEQSVVTNATVWSDGKVVHEGAHYVMVKPKNSYGTFSTPWSQAGDDPLEFPGVSLTLSQSDTGLYVQSHDYTISNIYVAAGGSIIIKSTQGAERTLRGTEMRMASGARLQISARNASKLHLDTEITGDQDCCLIFGAETQATSAWGGDYYLDGDNSKYYGHIRVASNFEKVNKTCFDDATYHYTRLHFSSGKALGGACDEFTYDAIKVNERSALVADAEVTLVAANRGIYAENDMRISVPDASHTLTIGATLTLTNMTPYVYTSYNGYPAQNYDVTNDTLDVVKMGAGTLALGGALKFRQTDGTLGDIPAEGVTNVLDVVEGTIKAADANAFNGFNILFRKPGKNAAVALAVTGVAATDAGYGILNLKAPHPLALQTGLAAIPLRIDAPAAAFEGEGKAPILTVAKAVAAADGITTALFSVPDKVELNGIRYRTALVAEDVTVNETACTRFAVTLTPPKGMSVLIK